MRKNRVAIVTAALTGVVALAVPTYAMAGEPGCELEILDQPDAEGHTRINGMDATGTNMAGSFTPTGNENEQLLLWKDGSVESIMESSGNDEAVVWDIDSSGTAVGYYRDAETRLYTPFVHQDGEFTELALPSDAEGGTSGNINENGVITGTIIDFDGQDHPAYWPSAEAEAIPLETPNDHRGVVRDLDEDNRMIGSYDETKSISRAYQWDAEGEPAEVPGEINGYPTGLAGDYMVGMRKYNGDGVNVMWTGDGEPEELEGFDSVNDVTADGTVLGEINGDKGAYRPLDGETVELPGLSDDDGAWNQPAEISADGTVIGGNVEDDNGFQNPARWSCS